MEVVLKPCQDRFLHPILVHYKKNTGSQMGHTKNFLKKKTIEMFMITIHCSQYFQKIVKKDNKVSNQEDIKIRVSSFFQVCQVT